MDRVYHIYGLVDPNDGQIRYVGMSLNPRKRFREHISHGRTQNNRTVAGRWIADLMSSGKKPDIVILETITSWSKSRAIEAEGEWIFYLRKKGVPLLNVYPMIEYGYYQGKSQVLSKLQNS